MTYKELYESAIDKLEKSKITLGEFEKMIEPLNAEIDTDSDTISRQAAISAICNACGKIDCDKMDKCEKLQLPPANCSEFPNNSDTISRQAAIDALRAMQTYKLFAGDDMLLIDQAGAQTELMMLPPAQPERITSRWIPCGERPPENDNDVLVQMNDGSMMVDCRAASSNGWFWAELDDEPVAWMPLPEPYKGVTE